MPIPFNPATDIPSSVNTVEAEIYRLCALLHELKTGKTIKISGQTYGVVTYDRKVDDDGIMRECYFLALPVSAEVIPNPQNKRFWQYALALENRDTFPSAYK